MSRILFYLAAAVLAGTAVQARAGFQGVLPEIEFLLETTDERPVAGAVFTLKAESTLFGRKPWHPIEPTRHFQTDQNGKFKIPSRTYRRFVPQWVGVRLRLELVGLMAPKCAANSSGRHFVSIPTIQNAVWSEYQRRTSDERLRHPELSRGVDAVIWRDEGFPPRRTAAPCGWVAANDFPDDGLSGAAGDEIEDVPPKLKCRVWDQDVVFRTKLDLVDPRNCISIFGHFGD